MIWIYRLLFPFLFLVSLPYYGRRMLKRGGYGKDFQHRLGFFKPPPKAEGVKRVWIQAVSVGELLALAPLLKRLEGRRDVDVVLTTTTSTGYAVARENYSTQVAAVGLFPFDFWPLSWITWRRVRPDLVALMESELWPEHLHQARSRGVPVVLINGRMSNRSFQRYEKMGMLADHLLGHLDTILAGTAQDRDRFIKLGTPEEDTLLAGNLKFDVRVEPLLGAGERAALRRELGFAEDDLVLLGSSTWPGEEAILTVVLEEGLVQEMPLRLLLVPRHAERRSEVRALLETQDLPYHFRSDKKQAAPGTRIYVADTTGELRKLTQVADVVFVGKSLFPPNLQGQTPVEAAALAKPIVFGPGMSNFVDIANGLLQCGAAIAVGGPPKLKDAMLDLLKDPGRRAEMAEAARKWHEANQGAVDRCLEAVDFYLDAKD